MLSLRSGSTAARSCRNTSRTTRSTTPARRRRRRASPRARSGRPPPGGWIPTSTRSWRRAAASSASPRAIAGWKCARPARNTAASISARSAARRRGWRRTASRRSSCSNIPSSGWRRSGASRSSTSRPLSWSTTRGTIFSRECREPRLASIASVPGLNRDRGERRLDGGDPLAELLAGGRRSWDGFVRRYAALIVAAVRGVAAGSGDIEDLTQEVFVRLCKDDFRLLRSYDATRASLSTWLTIVARGAARDDREPGRQRGAGRVVAAQQAEIVLAQPDEDLLGQILDVARAGGDPAHRGDDERRIAPDKTVPGPPAARQQLGERVASIQSTLPAIPVQTRHRGDRGQARFTTFPRKNRSPCRRPR